MESKALMKHEFFHAMFQGNNKTMIDLLRQGININEIEDEGTSCLSYACSFPMITIGVCKLFIKHGANIHHIDSKGNTALHYTSEIDKAKLLIKNKIDLNIINIENEVALEIHIKNNRFELAQYLIDAGADYKLVNWDKMSEEAKNIILFPIVAQNEKDQLENLIQNNQSSLKIKL